MENLKIPYQALELLILRASALNLSFFMKIKPYLDTNKTNKSYFIDEKNQIIFNLYCKYFDKFKTQPKKETFLALVAKYAKTKKMEEELVLYLKKIAEDMYSSSAEEIDFDFIEEETISFIKESRVFDAVKEVEIDIETGNYSAIVSKMEDAVRVSFDKDLGTSVNEMEKIMSDVNRVVIDKVISSGYKNLDSFLDGGLHPREIYCIAGLPGVGKTGLLLNIAINSYIQGKKVLYYTFETSRERLFMRMIQNITSYSKKEILADEEQAKEKFKQETSLIQGDLIIKEYNANAVSSNDLMAHIYDLSMYKNWKPDIVFVDYVLIMLTNDRRMSSENSYKYYKTVAEELRNIAKTLDISVFTAAQIGREGMADRGGSKAILTAKNISESRGIYDTVDVFLPMIQTAKDKEKNKFFLFGDKVRNDVSSWRIEYNIDYEHMKIKEGAIIS